MKIEMISIRGMFVRALLVDKSSPHTLCENCGKPKYSHELLAKSCQDWCMNCDDDYYRGHMSEEEIALWSVEQMSKGLAVIVATQESRGNGLVHLGL